MKLAQFDAIIFDFDGVLVESVDVKTKAFASLYSEYGPDVVEKVIAYHLEHGGISRFRKFKHFHSTFLGQELIADDEARLGRRFAEIVEDAVVASPWVGGASEFLDAYCQEIPLFVASGTPDDELHRIVERRGMRRYFVSIHGSPATKREIIRRIVTEHGFRKERVLMVGDSMTDYQGAVEAGVAFLARTPDAARNGFPEAVTIIPDLRRLPDLI